MRVFVTGVGGQLGHDVMNELAKRGYDGVGSDIQEVYSGVQDGTAVTEMTYVQLDITDREKVISTIAEIRPDAVIHCAAWTAVDIAEDDDKVDKFGQSMQVVHRILQMPAKNWIAKCSICPQTMFLTDRGQNLGSRTARTTSR